MSKDDHKEHRLDTLKMLTEIDELVSVDEGETWSWKAAEHKPFTQEESERMAQLIGRVYMVAHCVHCEACAPKWYQETLPNNNGSGLAETHAVQPGEHRRD